MTVTEEKSAKSSLYRLGEISFQPERRIIQSQTEQTVIEPRMSDVLCHLIAKSGPVTRHELLDDVWGDDGSDEALTQVVSRLRRAMGDVERPYKIILTVPRGGYELGPSPERIDTMPALVATENAGSKPSWLSQNKRFLAGYAAGILTALLIVLGWLITHPPAHIEIDISCYPGSQEPECQTLSEGT